ncbi:cell division protein CrgA [Psychromicrobium sp. YIM B11713]|uniref:cell division protein CrgA n=1 Tax=Psychromicrobium sp. YIM B11713 TaxID=3145233 RepID=UPI00374F97CC
MPESKSRRRTARPTNPDGSKAAKPNAVWYKPVMFGLMIIGLLWIITFYITSNTTTQLPIPGIGAWNIVIGFGIAIVGFLMTTRWRS